MAFFGKDGSLNYSSKLSKLVYTYRYRNQYVVMDTCMSLIHRGFTIDSNSIAKIKLSKIDSISSINSALVC